MLTALGATGFPCNIQASTRQPRTVVMLMVVVNQWGVLVE